MFRIVGEMLSPSGFNYLTPKSYATMTTLMTKKPSIKCANENASISFES